MSQVQLQVKPRRSRCAGSNEPPPFRFDAVLGPQAERRPAVLRLPAKAVALFLATIGGVIDVAFFLVGLTIWCGMHLVLWSYAFEAGPAADCFGLPCPPWLGGRVLRVSAALAVITFWAARALKRLGHRATSTMLLVLVTFDVAALFVLGAQQLI